VYVFNRVAVDNGACADEVIEEIWLSIDESNSELATAFLITYGWFLSKFAVVYCGPGSFCVA